MLEQDITKKGQVNNILPESEKEFEAKNNKKYKVKAIIDNAVYNKKVNNQMLSLYYLILWKSYLKKKYLGIFSNSYALLEVNQHLS